MKGFEMEKEKNGAVRIGRDRFALGSYQYLRYPLEYFLDTAVELGIPNIELWAAAPGFCLDTMDEGQLRQKASLIRERGLRVCCITPEQCQYPVNLAAEDGALRAYSIRNIERAIHAANRLECPKILVTAGCGYFNRPREEAWERSRDSLYQLAVTAQENGVLLLLETLTPLSSNILNTPEQQAQMIRTMPEGSIKPMLDIGQMAYMEQDLARYLEHGTDLAHVHLQDSHPAIHMALGDGDLPLLCYLEQIEASGYRGYYALELNDPRYRTDPREADRKSVNWLLGRHIFE